VLKRLERNASRTRKWVRDAGKSRVTFVDLFPFVEIHLNFGIELGFRTLDLHEKTRKGLRVV